MPIDPLRTPRDPARIPRILRKINGLWIRDPDLRLCQLLFNAGVITIGIDPYYKEDDAVETSLTRYEEGLRRG